MLPWCNLGLTKLQYVPRITYNVLAPAAACMPWSCGSRWFEKKPLPEADYQSMVLAQLAHVARGDGGVSCVTSFAATGALPEL
jgi:hypothetical protein